MLIVGIIGPYFSGGDRRLIDHNIANAQYVMIRIANHFAESKLVGFFCPHSHTARFEKLASAPEPYYHALDNAMYDRSCRGFIVLPDWEKSSGSLRDHKRAIEQGKPIFALQSYQEKDIQSLLALLEAWAKS